jgi:predicted transposase/invertase (TIGR01784 family)
MSGIHDNFVKQLFRDPENVRGFLENSLPEDLAVITDFSSLKYEDTTYVDPDLRDQHTDLLFSFITKDKIQAKFYLLFEHKSYPDSDTALQQAGYIIQVYKDQRKKISGDDLKPVIPVLFSQGLEGEWKMAVTLSDLFSKDTLNHPVLARFIPMYDAILVDIAKDNLERFRSLKLLYSSLTLMKYAKSELLEPIEEAFIAMGFDEKMIASRNTLILYLIRNINLPSEEIINRIKNPRVRSEIMTTEEQLIQKGIEEGIEKGIEQGSYQKACQTAMAMIRAKKLEYREIAEYTDLTLEDIERLAKES